jgi:MYXO-CTERM domain-containing protein
MRWPLAALPLILVAVSPAAAHNTYEAAELEMHLINDEGSDLIESYGGYDIQDIFAGFSHDMAVAADGVYLRAELYGARSESAVPQDGAEWSVTFHLEAGGQAFERTLRTTDGQTFTSDFDALQVEVEDRDTHVQRAFLRYEGALAAGGNLTLVRVDSRVDGDLRDYAPGGIPVPGTNGAREYPEPGSTRAKGLIQGTVALRNPDHYVHVGAEAEPGGSFQVTVKSALKKGAQHIMVRTDEAWGHRLEGNLSAAVAANGSLTFRILAPPTPANGTLWIDVLTDVGGRSRLHLEPSGALVGPAGLLAQAQTPEPEPSPSPVLFAVLALALVGLAARRRR